ncbi:MAG: glycosyltransferase family 39 protein [Candidatus Omnitrophota bacterium]
MLLLHKSESLPMEPATLQPRIRILIGIVLLVYVLGIQLIGVQRPFLGHYASYQGTVMASIARNMVRENFSDVFLPKTDSMLEGQRSLHLNQFPLPSLLTACGVKFVGGTYEFWGRFQAIIFNLFTIFLIFSIAKRFFGEAIGGISAAIYALSPLTIVYGQSLMSEPSSLFFFFLSLYVLVGSGRWSFWNLILSALLFSVALAGRVHWVLFLPFFFILVWRAQEKGRLTHIVVFGSFALFLPVIWYAHTYFASLHAPHVHTNLFLQAATSQKGSAFLLHADLYRALALTLGKSMMALVMVPFFFMGLRPASRCPQGRFCLLAGIGMILLMTVLSPEKLIRHDFYLYPVLPFLAVITAFGVVAFLRYFSRYSGFAASGLLVVFWVASAFFCYGPIFRVSEDEKAMFRLAEWIRERTPAESMLVIGGGSPVLAFYVDRPSSSIVPQAIGQKLSPYLRMTAFTGRDKASLERLEKASQSPIDWLEYLRSQGAAYFVVPEPHDFQAFPEFLRYLAENYTNISDDPQHYLFYRLKTASPANTTT